MNLSWLYTFLLVLQPASIPESLVINYQGETIARVERAHYAFPLPGLPLINNEKYHQLLDELEHLTYEEPKNAYIDPQGVVRDGVLGRKLYRKAFTDIFHTYFYKTGSSTIEIPMLPLYPKVDRDLLLNIRVKQIGQYVTYFNANNEARSHNIKLAAEAINNHVIFPQETFSFNRIVGKRTKERGYMRAPVIVKGELSEDIGGGICQVSSTLYNATDRAGLKIVERYSHSKSVPYVPSGRDAAVSWNGPDFSFINTYSFPLLIRARAIGGQMLIQIFSSDEIEYEPRSIPEAAKLIPDEIDVNEVKRE